MLGKLTQSGNINKLIDELSKTKIDVDKLDKILASGNTKINGFIDKDKKTTLLHKFLKGSNFAASQWLLQNQANPYTEDDYNLPAFFYFMHSSISTQLYHALVENNIDFNYKNSQGRTVLQDIVINGDIALYNRVLKNVKKPFSLDDYGKNILFDAISSGDKETMNLIFDHEDAPLDIQDNHKDSLLHFVKDGDLSLIEFLLEKGVPPTLQDKDNKNIIFYLSERIEKTNSEMDIKHLTKLIDISLNAKDALDQKDKDGNNLLTGFLNTLNKPLSQYSQKNFLSDLITKFIDSGINIDEKNEDGDNAILLAVNKNDVETVMLLIQKGADINVQNAEDITPLALAVMKGTNEYYEMVKLLLSGNANPNLKDSDGSTIIEKIIYILIYISRENLKKEMLKKEAEGEVFSLPPIPVEEGTPEEDLSRFNQDDFMRNIFELLLIKNMIDYDVFNSQGNPYFFILIFTENTYLAELMFKHGADINQGNINNQNVLQFYLDFADKNKINDSNTVRTMRNIVKLGVDLQHRDDQGATITHNTILSSPLSITKTIVKAGASIDVADNKGRTLLHNAIWANDLEKVKYIVGVKKELINVPDKLGVIPINYAAFLGNRELICYLISHGSYVNNLHDKLKSTLDFFKRFHKNIFKLENEKYDDTEQKRHVLILINNMKEEFNIVE